MLSVCCSVLGRWLTLGISGLETAWWGLKMSLMQSVKSKRWAKMLDLRGTTSNSYPLVICSTGNTEVVILAVLNEHDCTLLECVLQADPKNEYKQNRHVSIGVCSCPRTCLLRCRHFKLRKIAVKSSQSRQEFYCVLKHHEWLFNENALVSSISGTLGLMFIGIHKVTSTLFARFSFI